MIEFLDSLPCPAIDLTTFFVLYLGSFAFGVFTLLNPHKLRGEK